MEQGITMQTCLHRQDYTLHTVRETGDSIKVYIRKSGDSIKVYIRETGDTIKVYLYIRETGDPINVYLYFRETGYSIKVYVNVCIMYNWTAYETKTLVTLHSVWHVTFSNYVCTFTVYETISELIQPHKTTTHAPI